MSGKPDLHAYQWVVCNSSGGKDSIAALEVMTMMADAQGYPRSRVVVSHQLLGPMEWPGALELVERQAARLGLRLLTSRYRTANQEEPVLLEVIEKRGKWPDSSNRYCTSDFKRGPGGRVLTELSREQPGAILNCYGFRAQESPARAKRTVLARNARFSTKTRPVTDYLPIHDWTEQQVWNLIHRKQIPYPEAYKLGMCRYSCVFCVFASKSDLLIAGRANPELLAQYVGVEQRTGHRFRQNLSLQDIQNEINTTAR